ncbi:kinase-like domain-containing protein [Hypoxylon fuscum]|nr:kinase-like domain-containing protein [Hypoxylon fuscum]
MPPSILPVLFSIDEVRASTEILSRFESVSIVVKVSKDGKEFAVKFGVDVDLVEAETLAFVELSTKSIDVPVPKIFGTMIDPNTHEKFIVMEYIESQNLTDIWEHLTPGEVYAVEKQLAQAFESLRKIKPNSYHGRNGYFGRVNTKPFNHIFWTPGQSGPFLTEMEFNEGILKALEKTENNSYISILRNFMSYTLIRHTKRFTHGNLRPRHIMVRRTSTTDCGHNRTNGVIGSGVEIAIIDWKMAG